MATIGSVLISVYAKTEGLRKSLSKAQNTITGFAKKAAKTMAGIGAIVGAGLVASVAAIVSTVNKYASEIDKLAKTSSKLGLTVSALQKLQYQAELSGVSADTMSTALQRMVRRVSEAAKGTGAAKDALKELGLSAKQLNSLSPDQQFYAISEAMKSISNQGDKVRLAMKIFDTEGVSLVNTMSANLKKVGEEFDSLGISITQSGAAMVESYNDSKSKLSAIFSGFGIKLTEQLAGPFTKLIEFINKTIQEMGGMEAAANSFARFMIKAIGVAIESVQSLIKMFVKLENLMLRIENLSLAPKIAGEAAGSFVSGSADIGPATQRSFDIDKQIAKNNTELKDNSAIKALDGLLKTLEAEVGKKLDFSDVIKPEHYRSFDNAAEKTNQLATAASKAAAEISSIKGAAAQSGSGENIYSENYKNNQSLGNLVADYTKNSPAGQTYAKLRESGAFGSESAKNAIGKNSQSLGKVEIGMQTDTGRVAGEIFGEPEFLRGLKSFSDRQTNKEARVARG